MHVSDAVALIADETADLDVLADREDLVPSASRRPSCRRPCALQARSASTSAGFSSITVSAQVSTNSVKLAFFATKSVSALTSMTTPILPQSETFANATPSAAILLAFLTEAARPFSRRSSVAFSMSPFASASAFLQSIMPQPVFALSVATSFAVKLIFYFSFRFNWGRGKTDYASVSASSFSSVSCAAAPIWPSRPSMIAFAIAPAIRRTARIASSLPGIT